MKQLKKKGRPAEERIKEIPLDMINEPESMSRVQMNKEKLEELKKSILAVGLLHPITIKERGDMYEVVSGFRRYVAHKELGRVAIKARIDYRQGEEYELAKLHENIVREDISAYEEALAFAELIDVHGYTQAKIAQSIGKSEGYISQRLLILKAPKLIQEALMDNQMSFSVARELMQIEDESEMIRLAMMAIQNGVTPAVMRSWRMQWEAEQGSPERRDEDGSSPERGEYSAPVFEFKCAGCSEMFPFSKMHSVNLCPSCKRIITNPPESD